MYFLGFSLLRLVSVHARIRIFEIFVRNEILSRVIVTNNAGSELDERVYLLLIHAASNHT